MLSTAACAAAAAAETWAWDAEEEMGGEFEGEWEGFNCWGGGNSGGDRLLLIELIVVFDATEEGKDTDGGGDPDKATTKNRYEWSYI